MKTLLPPLRAVLHITIVVVRVVISRKCVFFSDKKYMRLHKTLRPRVAPDRLCQSRYTSIHVCAVLGKAAPGLAALVVANEDGNIRLRRQTGLDSDSDINMMASQCSSWSRTVVDFAPHDTRREIFLLSCHRAATSMLHSSVSTADAPPTRPPTRPNALTSAQIGRGQPHASCLISSSLSASSLLHGSTRTRPGPVTTSPALVGVYFMRPALTRRRTARHASSASL